MKILAFEISRCKRNLARGAMCDVYEKKLSSWLFIERDGRPRPLFGASVLPVEAIESNSFLAMSEQPDYLA